MEDSSNLFCLGVAIGVATSVFAKKAKEEGWMDRETANSIAMAGFGVSCVSSVPLLARDVQQGKIPLLSGLN